MVLIICLFVALVVGFGTGRIERNRRLEAKKPKKISSANLSWPAKQIIKKYNDLPAENRPFDDVHSLLSALDIKHDVSKVNHHFRDRYYDDPTWNCDCSRFSSSRHCVFQDYKEIKVAIDDITTAIAEQKHALEMSRVAHELDSVKAFTQSLRAEKEIITSVTKELT